LVARLQAVAAEKKKTGFPRLSLTAENLSVYPQQEELFFSVSWFSVPQHESFRVESVSQQDAWASSATSLISTPQQS
jgi:hypothetical protein